MRAPLKSGARRRNFGPAPLESGASGAIARRDQYPKGRGQGMVNWSPRRT